MTKTEKMDEFLKYYAKVFKQNPSLQINKDIIYAGLMNYGLDEHEQNQSIRPLFDKWIKRYDNKKLDVFHSTRQNRFLQFHNDGYSKSDYVKIYLSFGADDIEECVNIIFDYIDKNNFKTLSKVADITRSDSVVLRICEIEDAKKIINFINNNQYLKSKAKEVNPFTIQNGIVGMANDRKLSYNETVAYLIQDYYKSIEDLNRVSIDDFKNYMLNTYNSIFKDKTKLDKFKNTSIFAKYSGSFNSDNEEVVNYYEVFITFLMSLNENTKIEDFYKHVSNCQDNNKHLSLVKHFDNHNNEIKPINKEDLLSNFVLYASKKYGRKNVKLILQDYINGNQNAITRDNNYRKLFQMYISREDILRITNNDLEMFVGVEEENEQEILNVFKTAIIDTFQKYGLKQACHALRCLFKQDFRYITNGTNYNRDRLQKYNYDKLIEIINSYLSNIELNDNEDYIETAVSYMIANNNRMSM